MTSPAWPSFVPRGGELADCIRHLGGDGRVLRVLGEKGVGKTALLREVHEQADKETAATVGAGASEFSGRTSPFALIRQLGSLLIGVSDDVARGDLPVGTAALDHARQDVALKRSLARYPDVVGRLFSLPSETVLQRLANNDEELRSLIGLQEEARQRSAEQIAPKAVENWFLDVVSAWTELGPLWIMVDDLDWGDASSLEVLAALAAVPKLDPSAKLLVSYQSDKSLSSEGRLLVRAWAQHSELVLNLQAAAEQNSVEFCSALLDEVGPLTGGVSADDLAAFTGGNALLARECIRRLREGSVSPTAIAETGGGALEALVERLQFLVEGRISELGESAAEILEVASVQGLEFDAEVLARVLERPLSEVLKTLDQELREREHLVRDVTQIETVGQARLPVGGRPRFRFIHGLYRDYFYGLRIGGARKVALHHEVAIQLLQIHGQQVDADILMRHFLAAGDISAAAEAAVSSVRKSVEIGDYAGAASICSTMLEIAGQGAGTNSLGADPSVCELYLQAARVSRVRGSFSQAGQMAEIGLAYGDTVLSDDSRRGLTSELVRSLYNLDQDMERARSLLAPLVISSTRPEEKTDLLRQLGIVHQRLGDFASATDAYSEALGSCRDFGSQVGTDLVNSIGVSLAALGCLPEAEWCQLQALNFHKRAGADNRRTLYLNDLASVRAWRGEDAGALDALDEVKHLAERQGKVGALARALSEEAYILSVSEEGGHEQRLDEIAGLMLTLEQELGGEWPVFFRFNILLAQTSLRSGTADAAEFLASSRRLNSDRSWISGVGELVCYPLLAVAAANPRDARERLVELEAARDWLGSAPSPGAWHWEYLRLLSAIVLSKYDRGDVPDTDMYGRAFGRCSTSGTRRRFELLAKACGAAEVPREIGGEDRQTSLKDAGVLTLFGKLTERVDAHAAL